MVICFLSQYVTNSLVHNIVGMQTMFDSEIGVDEGSHSLILPHVETAKHL